MPGILTSVLSVFSVALIIATEGSEGTEKKLSIWRRGMPADSLAPILASLFS